MLEAKDMKWNNGIVKLFKRTNLLKHGGMLTIEPVRKLEVLVKDRTGNPLKGVRVPLSEREWSSMPTSRSRVTDDSGLAVFDRIFTGGIYRFYPVELEGYSHQPPKEPLIAGSPGGKDKIEIVMESGQMPSD